MWNQKQNNEIYPGRVNGPSRSQDPHDGNTILSAPSDVSDRDFVAESSRKRKAVVMSYPGNAVIGAISQSVSANNCPDESNHQQKYGVVSIMNEQGNTTKGFSNLLPSLGSGVKVIHPGRYQSQGPNSSLLNSETNDKNFQNDVAEKVDNSNLSAETHAFHQNGPSNIVKLPAGAHKHISQIEAHKHPYPDMIHRSMETVFSGHGLMNGMNFGHINHSSTVNSSTGLSLKPSEFFGSSGVSQTNNEVFNHNVSLDGTSFETTQNGQSLDVARTKDNSILRTSLMETAPLEGVVTKQSFQNSDSEVRTGCPPNNCLTSELKVRHQNDGNHDAQITEGKGSKTENENHSLGVDVSPKVADRSTQVLTGQGYGDYSQHAASKLDGKSKLHANRIMPATEKLWSGSLQLNASVTVSAVAFFKSGEKSPEVKWSKSIVVKGKVRLEAFERYIQELPRSRSRGLMVTSLCWRVGSSETGLAGMKEVAKAYKEGEKVGFAQISRSIDLYVCPRSDTIITILAKYGFFKGMAALEEDQDSLIGCVVWRRNHTSSDSVTKKSKNKISPLSEKHLDSTDPVISQTEKDISQVTLPGESFSPLVSGKFSAPPNIPGNKSIQSSEVQVEVGTSMSVIIPGKSHLVPQSSPAISVGFNSAPLPVFCSQNRHMSRQIETSVTTSSGTEKLHAGLELPRPVLSPRTITTKNRQDPDDNDDSADDDDLPEFDFSTACGISLNSVGKSPLLSTGAHVSDTAPSGMKVSAEEATNVSGHMPSAPHTVQAMVIGSQQRSQAMTFQVVPGGNQPDIYADKFGEGEPSRPELSFSDEKPESHSNEQLGQPGSGNPTTSMALPTPKNLWDDDDDMPEWCPPDLEHQCRPKMISTMRPSIPCVPSPVPNPNLDKLPGPPPVMTAVRPSSTCISSPVPNRNSENILPGPPPRIPTSGPSNSYMPSPVPNRNSENVPPGPPPKKAISRPPSSFIPPPVPPPTIPTSRPSFSYMPLAVPNRKSENTLPPPPPLRLPPPPPRPPLMSTHPPFHTHGLSHDYQCPKIFNVDPAQNRPVGPNTSMDFTYNPTSRPQANMFDVRPPIRPAGWKGWRP